MPARFCSLVLGLCVASAVFAQARPPVPKVVLDHMDEISTGAASPLAVAPGQGVSSWRRISRAMAGSTICSRGRLRLPRPAGLFRPGA